MSLGVTTVGSRVPPLENGDHLSRAEFERRWEAMPTLKHAELIRGVVHMPAALRIRSHGLPHRRLVGWIDRYIKHTDGIEGGDNASIRLDDDSMPQPDVCLFLPPEMGGTSRIDDDDYIDGAPEFAGEVAASSASIDLHEKFALYRDAGVREYLIWRVQDQQIDWFHLREGNYEPLAVDADGLLKSIVFPGLWLDVKAMLHGTVREVAEALRLGCQSEGHRSFTKRLQDLRERE